MKVRAILFSCPIASTRRSPRLLAAMPGYFAADGNAANTSAKSGKKWRIHFIPDETGEWTYSTSFRTGPDVAVRMEENAGKLVKPDGVNGTLKIAASDKKGRDHRAHGVLSYGIGKS